MNHIFEEQKLVFLAGSSMVMDGILWSILGRLEFLNYDVYFVIS